MYIGIVSFLLPALPTNLQCKIVSLFELGHQPASETSISFVSYPFSYFGELLAAVGLKE